MSAIFGLIHMNGLPVTPDSLGRMGDVLAAYGPDDSGTWMKGAVGVGQNLMCFTPEDRFERQPLVSLDGQRVLVSDARIDNRSELTRTLNISPAEARQWPDSAFILSAYEKWGQECASHLVGAFAFAIWDSHEQLLFLVRSPMGERSLYYHFDAETLVFATMPKGLFVLPHVPREIDHEQIADYMVTAPFEPGRTYYRDIHRLPAGNSLIVTRSGISLRRFWHANRKNEMRLPSDEQYVEAFNELFNRVIEDNLRSLTPVGAMMSGGLDSTSVAAVAAQLLKREGKGLTTFTEVPRTGFNGTIIKGRYADEAPFVQAMARMHDNISVNLIRTNGRFFLDNISRFFAAAEMPFRSTSNRMWWETIHHEAQQRGIRVLLTGVPGNLTISWAGRGLLSQLLRTGKWRRAWRESRAAASRNTMQAALRVLVGQGIMPFMPTPLWYCIERLRRRNDPLLTSNPPWLAYSAIRPEYAEAQALQQRTRKKGFDFRFRPHYDTRRARSETFDQLDGSSDAITGYRALYGVETRDPTGDMRIVDFCLSLPEEQYLRDGKSRWLIQRAMAHRLPAEILNNRQRGLQAADWFESLSGARGEILDELSRLEKSTLAYAALDLNRMRRLTEQMCQSGMDADRIIMDYRVLLEPGMMTGRFLRWFESGE